MRIIVQRVASASVAVAGQEINAIGPGLLVLAGFEAADQSTDLTWMANKLARLRIFPDESGTMNRSVIDVEGEVLLVSQFTLYASTRKGTRPSWSRAAPGDISRPLFDQFAKTMTDLLKRPVKIGQFGADMQVTLINDGPVTLMIDSQAPE